MMVPQPAQALVLLFKPDREARDSQTRDAVSEGSSPFFLWSGPAATCLCARVCSKA
jgi:hypothetical protein